MPTPELSEYEYRLLQKCFTKPLYRGLFGWPFDWNLLSFGGLRNITIPHLIQSGFIEFFYDWERERAAITITDRGLEIRRRRRSHRKKLL